MVTAATGRYVDLSSAYLAKARVHLAEGDLVQASEKGWGAAAVLVKACAEARGIDHDKHRHLWRTVNRLYDETGDRELRILFSNAESLHGNFYEDHFDEGAVRDFLIQVDVLVDKLTPLIDSGADE